MAYAGRSDASLTELLNQCQGLNLQLVGEGCLGARCARAGRVNSLSDYRMDEGDSRICHLCGVAFQASAQQVGSSSVSALTLPEAANSRLVFVNGVYAKQRLQICQMVLW